MKRSHRWRSVLALLLVVLAAWLVVEAVRWPDVEALRAKNPSTTAFIERYRSEMQARGESDRVERVWVPYARISPRLKKAVLVAEDINFFSHSGFDTAEMRQALRTAVAERKTPRGASTLTQQLARNLWLSPSRNPLRKLREALLTAQLERTLPKERIFELYLNVVEFGPGVYGAEAAARHYFGTSASRLGKRRAARLAAALPAPGRLNPARIRADHWRVRLIRERMERVTFLDRHL